MNEADKCELAATIQGLVDLETKAWDTQNAELLVSLFHPDMVWPWPPEGSAHDPITWVFPQGRFQRERWRDGWQRLFDDYRLVHNRRVTRRIQISEEGDGALAVVDVDTLWRHKTSGEDFHWCGRACKGYTLMPEGWKLIYHTGLLKY